MLKLRDVSINSQGHNLTNLNLEVENGEVVVLLGPNGSGKSTLLRTIADPDRRFRGEIIINHFSGLTEPDKAKRQIGYAAPTVVIEPYLTGFEYLEWVASHYHLSAKERHQELLRLAAAFDCQEDLYDLGERLSGSTQQKIRLLASLIATPSLIIWDDPTIFLDHHAGQALKNELRRHVERGGSALIATNDLTFAEQVADRIVILKDGAILTEGTVSQLGNLSGERKKNLTAAYDHLTADD